VCCSILLYLILSRARQKYRSACMWELMLSDRSQQRLLLIRLLFRCIAFILYMRTDGIHYNVSCKYPNKNIFENCIMLIVTRVHNEFRIYSKQFWSFQLHLTQHSRIADDAEWGGHVRHFRLAHFRSAGWHTKCTILAINSYKSYAQIESYYRP